jgi:hypothetical protein
MKNSVLQDAIFGRRVRGQFAHVLTLYFMGLIKSIMYLFLYKIDISTCILHGDADIRKVIKRLDASLMIHE